MMWRDDPTPRDRKKMPRVGESGQALLQSVPRPPFWHRQTRHPTTQRRQAARRSDRRCGTMTGSGWPGCAAAIALLLGASTACVAASVDDLIRAYPDALAGFDGSNL